jgi:hypothetical protein
LKKTHELCIKAKLEAGEIDEATARSSTEEEHDTVSGGDSSAPSHNANS